MIMAQNKKGIAYDFYEGKLRRDINIVFVHGTGCHKKFLESTKQVLEDYNLYYIDLPGHGESEDSGYTSENYIKAIIDFSKTMENVILIGHSLGGTLVLGALEKRPQTVIGAIIASGALKFRNLDPVFFGNIHKGIIDRQYVLNGFGHLDNEDVKEAIMNLEAKEVALKDWAIDETIDLRAEADQIQVPIELLVGEKDEFAPRSYAEEIVSKVPYAEITEIENGKHMIVIAKKQILAVLVKKLLNKSGK